MLVARVLRTPKEKAILLNADLGENFMFFNRDTFSHRSFIVVEEAGTLVGLTAITEESARMSGAVGVAYVSTHKDHKNRGVAKVSVEALFQFAQELGKDIANTLYEDEGEKWLKPVLHAAAKRYPSVQLHER